MCLCILTSEAAAGACLHPHLSFSSFHSLVTSLYYLSVSLCQLICSICQFPPWWCNWFRSSRYPVRGNSPFPVCTYVNECSYASTNPLQCDSHLALQRVDIRGGYHWFYIVAAWHSAQPLNIIHESKLGARDLAKWGDLVLRSVHLSSAQHFFLLLIV